jgi:hypothetical protein
MAVQGITVVVVGGTHTTKTTTLSVIDKTSNQNKSTNQQTNKQI